MQKRSVLVSGVSRSSRIFGGRGELGLLRFIRFLNTCCSYFSGLVQEFRNMLLSFLIMICESGKCGKVKNTMMYTGSPHNPRVLQSPFNMKEILLLFVTYKRHANHQEQSSWTK